MAVALLDGEAPFLDESLPAAPLPAEPFAAAEVSPEPFADDLDDPSLETFAPFRLSVR